MMNLHEFLGSSGANLPIDFIATTAHLEPNTAYGVSTKNGSVTVTLPMDSMAGDRIAIFDSDLTWSESKLVDVKWSYLVEGSLVNEVVSLTKKGGSIELVYLGESRGWVDARYYLSDTHPTWQWGWLKDESDKVYHYMEGGELSLGPESLVTTSGSHTIDSNGTYLLIYAGGGGGSTTSGGNTIIKLNEDIIAISFGAGKGDFGAGEATTMTGFLVRRLHTPLGIIQGGDVFLRPISDTLASLQAAYMCGYRGITGVRGYRHGTFQRGGSPKYMDSFLIELKKGDVLDITIGAKAAGELTEDGRVSIFKVNF